MADHTILVHGNQSAVISAHTPTQYTVTAYVGAIPTVAYTCATVEEAERWATAVIAYPTHGAPR